jgi:hypothetical protein
MIEMPPMSQPRVNGFLGSRDRIASLVGRGFVPTRPVDTFEIATGGAGATELIDLRSWGGRLPEMPTRVEHGLADHPLLTPDRIRDALAKVPDDCVDVRAVDDPEPGDASTFGRRRRVAMSATDALRAMETGRLWMNVQKVHRFDRGFHELVSNVLRSIAASIPGLSPEVYGAGAYLIVSSGRASCHFHADPDLNFLMQVRGTKRVFTWSPDVLDERTKEALAETGDHGACPYKPEYATRAEPPVDLVPGTGVFIPLFAPHRVENGDEPCVSLSVGFVPRSAMVRLRVHQVNRALRKLGLPVRDCGQSPAIDAIKHPLHLGLRLLRRTSLLGEVS